MAYLAVMSFNLAVPSWRPGLHRLQNRKSLWEYKSFHWAGVFLDVWLKRAMRIRLEPIKKVARSIRAHEAIFQNWFAAKKQLSSCIVEDLNVKIKLTIRKAFSYRILEVAETIIYHTLADLPEPKLAHEFCQGG